MIEERRCGDDFCLVAALKEDMSQLTATQQRLIEMLAEQKALFTQVNSIQYEFNRFRDNQDEANKESIEKISLMVCKKDLILYLTILGGALAFLSFVFNYIR